MKKIGLLFAAVLLFHVQNYAQNEAAYFSLGTSDKEIENVTQDVKDVLTQNGFTVLGDYNVGNDENLHVVCYTHPDLEKIVLQFHDRGALAAALKVGMRKSDGKVSVSMINPMYLFYAYLIDGIEDYENQLRAISDKAISVIRETGNEFNPFGGSLEKEKLQKYHYKIMMPYFKDAEELKTFDSFEEGLKTIQGNLAKGKGQTVQVYKLLYPDKETAVFGVGLLNPEDGEAHFLPIIGEDHLAAMPYEIILQGGKATILPGKYRIALCWPELTMGTFMKIISTPGDIKKTLKGLTE